MSKYITNPISSNQVTEVPILKPDCADFCGRDLNAWLKWLVDQQCKYNWKNFDISCLDTTIPDCEKDLDTILKVIVENICTLGLTSGDSGCCGECTQDSINLILERGWEDFAIQSPAQAIRDGNIVHLKGRISGNGSTFVPIASIPDITFRPNYTRRVTFANTFFLSASRAELEIGSDGNINIVWSGVTPNVSQTGDIWLDGVSFIIN